MSRMVRVPMPPPDNGVAWLDLDRVVRVVDMPALPDSSGAGSSTLVVVMDGAIVDLCIGYETAAERDAVMGSMGLLP